MKPYIRLLFLAGLCVTPFFTVAKGVSSPEELGPYDFWSYIESRNGVITPVSERGDTDTRVEIVNPVISGIQVTGNLEADNQMTINGPTTWVNFDLSYSDKSRLEVSFIELSSRVSYELAAFGPPGQAQVQMVGGGVHFDNNRDILGSLFLARAGGRGTVAVYETDEAGNVGSYVGIWFIDSYSSTRPLSDMLTIDTNQLYKVIVESTANITVSNISSFELSAYVAVDPVLFSSETEGVQVHVSSYEYNESLSNFPPKRMAVRTDGSDTTAVFSSAARLTENTTSKSEFSVGDTIEIFTTLEPETGNIGQSSDIFVVFGVNGDFIQLTSTGLLQFDGTLETLIPFDQVILNETTELDILALFGGQVKLTQEMIGNNVFFIGYRTDDGVITYNTEPIIINVSSL